MDVLRIGEDGDFLVGKYRLSKHLDFDLAVRPDLGGEPHGQISVLGDMVPLRQRRSYARELSLMETSSFKSGRVPLFICYCGDLGCGALTVAVSASGEQIHWNDLGTESNWEKGFHQSDYMKRTGPFSFLRSDYLRALASYR